MRRYNHFDLASLGLIIFIFIVSVARFNCYPHFVDGYYHLSVANGFIQSGGWVGWDWWGFAPFGRPHLYPPLYHFILVFLQKIGISGLNSLRLTEVLITPLFFFSVWYVMREFINERFSFINFITLSSFFPFYSSVSGNIPASISIIFGLLSWFFIKKKKFISSTLLLMLSFYTHSGVPWIFIISFLFLALFNGEYRKPCLKIIFISTFLAFPILYHQIRYLSYLALEVLGEAKFINFSIFIIVFGLFSLLLHFRRKDFPFLLFWGYLIGSIVVFVKYPYRFFVAQGIIGLVFFSSLFFERIFSVLGQKKAKFFIAIIFLFLFFSHATFNLAEGRPKFNLANSTYYNFLSGKIYGFYKYKPLFISKFYDPILEVIKSNTHSSDIIFSNVNIVSQIFSALAQRPASNSLFGEVKLENKLPYHRYAKIIIWVKLPMKDEILNEEDLHWQKIYENDIAYVFLNLDYKPSLKIVKSKIKFNFIFFIFLFVTILLFRDIISKETTLKHI